jgi:perosamine synthetase
LNEKIIRSSRPFFPNEDITKITSDISKALEDGLLRNGQNLRNFERGLSEYLRIKNAIALDSDSSALETALNYFGVANREVIVCTNSFISVPNSVLFSGGKVVFADIREESLSMDPESLRSHISKDTCGVIVTHIAGFPNPDLKEIIEICKKHDLFLIEDSTHAIGATVASQKVGTFGDAGIFAFTPTKVLTTGEGGMLVTNNDELAQFAKAFSYYGSGPGKTNFVRLGRHMMMPEISAILGNSQLKRVEEFIEKRNKIANVYNKAFDNLASVSRVCCSSDTRSSYYKYPLTLGGEVDKIKFTKMLDQKFKIETGTVFYPPCHMQALYQELRSAKQKPLPVSEKILSKTITLPMHCELNETDVKYVVESVDSTLIASK